MEKKKQKRKEINGKFPSQISPRKIIINGNLTDFIKRHPDTIKKIEKFELSPDVRLSIKALPSDFKLLKTLLKVNPHALTAFIEFYLIDPAISKLWAETHKRKAKTSVIKCLRLQAALLYGFFKYCEENNEYPKYLKKTKYLAKHNKNLNPSLRTALCLEVIFNKIRTEITKQKIFLSTQDIKDRNYDNFKENMIDRGMKLLNQPDFQEQLNILNNFTFQILMRYQKYIIRSKNPKDPVDLESPIIFAFIYHLNKTFDRPKHPLHNESSNIIYISPINPEEADEIVTIAFNAFRHLFHK